MTNLQVNLHSQPNLKSGNSKIQINQPLKLLDRQRNYKKAKIQIPFSVKIIFFMIFILVSPQIFQKYDLFQVNALDCTSAILSSTGTSIYYTMDLLGAQNLLTSQPITFTTTNSACAYTITPNFNGKSFITLTYDSNSKPQINVQSSDTTQIGGPYSISLTAKNNDAPFIEKVQSIDFYIKPDCAQVTINTPSNLAVQTYQIAQAKQLLTTPTFAAQTYSAYCTIQYASISYAESVTNTSDTFSTSIFTYDSSINKLEIYSNLNAQGNKLINVVITVKFNEAPTVTKSAIFQVQTKKDCSAKTISMGASSILQYTGNTVSSQLTFPAATPSDASCPVYYSLKINYQGTLTQVNTNFGSGQLNLKLPSTFSNIFDIISTQTNNIVGTYDLTLEAIFLDEPSNKNTATYQLKVSPNCAWETIVIDSSPPAIQNYQIYQAKQLLTAPIFKTQTYPSQCTIQFVSISYAESVTNTSDTFSTSIFTYDSSINKLEIYSNSNAQGNKLINVVITVKFNEAPTVTKSSTFQAQTKKDCSTKTITMGASSILQYTGNTVSSQLTFPAATPSDASCPVYYSLKINYQGTLTQVNTNFGSGQLNLKLPSTFSNIFDIISTQTNNIVGTYDLTLEAIFLDEPSNKNTATYQLKVSPNCAWETIVIDSSPSATQDYKIAQAKQLLTTPVFKTQNYTSQCTLQYSISYAESVTNTSDTLSTSIFIYDSTINKLEIYSNLNAQGNKLINVVITAEFVQASTITQSSTFQVQTNKDCSTTTITMGVAPSIFLYTASTVEQQFPFSAATPSDKFCPLYYNLYITYSGTTLTQVNTNFGSEQLKLKLPSTFDNHFNILSQQTNDVTGTYDLTLEAIFLDQPLNKNTATYYLKVSPNCAWETIVIDSSPSATQDYKIAQAKQLLTTPVFKTQTYTSQCTLQYSISYTESVTNTSSTLDQSIFTYDSSINQLKIYNNSNAQGNKLINVVITAEFVQASTITQSSTFQVQTNKDCSTTTITMGVAPSIFLYTASTVEQQFPFSAATPSDKFCPLYYNLYITYSGTTLTQVNTNFGSEQLKLKLPSTFDNIFKILSQQTYNQAEGIYVLTLEAILLDQVSIINTATYQLNVIPDCSWETLTCTQTTSTLKYYIYQGVLKQSFTPCTSSKPSCVFTYQFLQSKITTLSNQIIQASETVLDSNIFKTVLLDLFIEQTNNFYGNKDYIITYRATLTAAPTTFGEFQMTIQVYKDCSYAIFTTLAKIKVDSSYPIKTDYYTGDKLQSITFTNAVLNDTYCDIYYDLWIDNVRQNSLNSDTDAQFIKTYNTFTFNNMQTLRNTSNIIVWYPVAKSNFTTEYNFLTNQTSYRSYTLTIRQWVNNINDRGKAEEKSELLIRACSLCGSETRVINSNSAENPTNVFYYVRANPKTITFPTFSVSSTLDATITESELLDHCGNFNYGLNDQNGDQFNNDTFRQTEVFDSTSKKNYAKLVISTSDPLMGIGGSVTYQYKLFAVLGSYWFNKKEIAVKITILDNCWLSNLIPNNTVNGVGLSYPFYEYLNYVMTDLYFNLTALESQQNFITNVNTNYLKPVEVNCGKLIYTLVRTDKLIVSPQPILVFAASQNFGNSTVQWITESRDQINMYTFQYMVQHVYTQGLSNKYPYLDKNFQINVTKCQVYSLNTPGLGDITYPLQNGLRIYPIKWKSYVQEPDCEKNFKYYLNFTAYVTSSHFPNENITSLPKGNYSLPDFVKFENTNQSADSRFLSVDQSNLNYEYGYYMINFTIYVYDPNETNINYVQVYAKSYPIKLEFKFWPYNEPPTFKNPNSLSSFTMKLGEQFIMNSGEASSDTALIMVQYDNPVLAKFMKTSVDNKTMAITFAFTPLGTDLINNYTATVVLWDDDPPDKKSSKYIFQATVIDRDHKNGLINWEQNITKKEKKQIQKNTTIAMGIHKITVDSRVTVKLSRNISRDDDAPLISLNSSLLNQTLTSLDFSLLKQVLQILMIPGQNQDPSKLIVQNYSVDSFDGVKIELKVKFSSPQDISRVSEDRLMIIVDPNYFLQNFTQNNQTPVYLNTDNLISTILPQVSGYVAIAFTENSEEIGSGLQNFMIANFVGQTLMSGKLDSFWRLINTLQVTIHMQGINLIKPGLSQPMIDILLLFTNPQIIPEQFLNYGFFWNLIDGTYLKNQDDSLGEAASVEADNKRNLQEEESLEIVIDQQASLVDKEADLLKSIGYDGQNYKKNLGFLFIVGEFTFFLSITLFFINTCCKRCLWKCRKIRRFSLNLMHSIIWPGILRYFTELFLEIAVASQLQLKKDAQRNFSYKSADDYANGIIGFLCLIIVCCFPFLAWFLILKNRDQIIIEEEEKALIVQGFNITDKVIARNYPFEMFPQSHNLEPLLESIDIEKGKAQSLFFVYFLIRRLLMSVVLIWLQKQGFIQIICLIILNLISVTMIAHLKPFESSFITNIEIFNEFFNLLLSNIYMIYTDWVPDPIIQDQMVWGQIAITCLMIFVNVSIIIQNASRQLFQEAKRFYKEMRYKYQLIKMQRLIERSKENQAQLRLEALQDNEANMVVRSRLPLKISSRLKIEALRALGEQQNIDYTHQMNLIKERARIQRQENLEKAFTNLKERGGAAYFRTEIEQGHNRLGDLIEKYYDRSKYGGVYEKPGTGDFITIIDQNEERVNEAKYVDAKFTSNLISRRQIKQNTRVQPITNAQGLSFQSFGGDGIIDPLAINVFQENQSLQEDNLEQTGQQEVSFGSQEQEDSSESDQIVEQQIVTQPENSRTVDNPFQFGEGSFDDPFNPLHKNSRVYSLLQRIADEERARYYYNKALQELKQEEPGTNWEEVKKETIKEEWSKEINFEEFEMPKYGTFHKA